MVQKILLRIINIFPLLVLPIMALGKVSLDAPLQDFTIPGFSKNGLPSWILKGTELQYLNQKNASVKRMNLLILTGNGDRSVETDFFSPSAKFFLNENRALGEQSLSVRGSNFKITGKEWQWDGNSRTVKIQKEVRITFNESIQLF